MTGGWWYLGVPDLSRKIVMTGLVILFFSVPLSISGMQIGLTIAMVGALWDMVHRRRLPRTPLDVPIILFVGVTFLSAIFASDPWQGIQQFLGSCSILVLYLVVEYGREERFLSRLLRILFWPASVVAVYGLVQHFAGWDFLRGNAESLHSLELGGRSVYFPKGTFSHYQTFANVFYILFCLSFSLAVGRGSRSNRLAWSLPALLIGSALVFSFTRGIWLAMLMAIVFIAVLQGRRVLLRVGAALVIAALLTSLSSSGIASRARSIFELEKNVERLLLWETTWNMIRDYPLLGVGVGNYQKVQSDYIREEIKIPMSRTHAHNILLQITVERGVFGLLIFFWIWYIILKEAFIILWKLSLRGGYRFSLVLGCLTGIVGFFCDGLFQNNFGDTEVVILFWLVVGIIMVYREKYFRGELNQAAVGGEC